jgi:hypothetical protein
MRSLLFLFFWGISQHLLAQNTAIPMSSGNQAKASSTLPVVHASDGIYDKFVLIRWETTDQASNFRLFRATSSAGASLQELTKVWQKSTWFCDYSAEKGRDYYYAIIGSDGTTSSTLSHFDKGYVKKDDKVAQDESLSEVSPDKYAAGRQVFALVSEVNTQQNIYANNDTVRVAIGMQNVFEVATPQTELRLYLSADATWDFDDKLISFKSYSGFPANTKIVLQESFVVPATTIPGNYYLLAIASPEGNILQTKTGSTLLKISGK